MTRARVATTLRLHRFELVAFSLAVLVFAGGTFLASVWIEGLTPPAGCLGFDDGSEAASAVACRVATRAFDEAGARTNGLTMPLLAITYAVGLFLGVPLVAREAERGTTRLAWSLAPSRWRWYLTTVAPVAAILVVLAFTGGAALDRFADASNRAEDLSASFTAYEARGGLLLAARAFFIFGVAVALGAIIGRSWPALIVGAIVVTIVLGTGENLYRGEILRREAVLVDPSEARPGDQYIDERIQLPDGTLVGWDYFGNGDGPYDSDGNLLYPIKELLVPGDRYGFVMAREAVVLSLVGLVAIWLGGLAVSRRRPG